MNNLLQDALIRKVTGAISHTSAPMQSRQEIAREVVREIGPMVAHATNNEPWYQSRVTIGALISIGTGVLALFGIVITPDDIATITSVALAGGTVLGGALTLYGRWKARTPIGGGR